MIFNDEIVEIEELEDGDCIDISVSDIHLFYANDILVKNSFAIPALADWMGAIISSKELFEDSKYLLKTLKTRFGENIHEIVTIGVSRKHMRLLNVSEDDQDIPVAMKDRMSGLDQRRNAMADSERTFVFEDEIATEGISLEDLD